MVSAETARLILQGIAEAMPLQGDDVVTRVEIRDGWGGAIHVRVHSLLPRGGDQELGMRIRTSIARLVAERHRVEIVWASPG